MNVIDSLFATMFVSVAIASFIAITTMTANLPKVQDSQTLFNSLISSKVIGLFFAMMLIPAMYFISKGMVWSALSTILLASVAAATLQRLSNRAVLILRQRNYI